MADTRLKVVSIMNYPPEPRLQRMCRMFLDSVIAHGGQSITLLYENHRPTVAPEQFRAADIEIMQLPSYDVGHAHFNLRFKLANLAKLEYPFLFIDADTVVLGDLNYLWQRRHAKPWIGIDHQWIASDARTHRAPFLNSGVQLVSDPAFYDLDAMLAVQNAAAPLSKAWDGPKETTFACPGHDQAVLYRYFQTIGYDYTHPEIGPEWNSCACVTQISRTDNTWTARTHSLGNNYDVQLVHYWSQYKPWAIDCPIFATTAHPA